MSAPRSGFLEGSPRLHYLEWNEAGAVPCVFLHGNSANAWWWRPTAEVMRAADVRMLALDLRGHGDSEWVRPPAYSPLNYADDLARFVDQMKFDRPVVIGHSMGGLSALAFLATYPSRARSAVAIDIPVTSTPRRNRYLQRLKSLPTVIYPDLETAKARFRLMPDEGGIPPELLAEIAEASLKRTVDGRYTMKFDRETFFGSDGLNVPAAICAVQVPLLLIRAEMSRIMSAEAAANATASNPLAHLVTIPQVHHHVLLERPDLLAHAIRDFVSSHW
jgi:pimeloyl-ACP methyl ester carboxylesterase